jgi:hypothetical protein
MLDCAARFRSNGRRTGEDMAMANRSMILLVAALAPGCSEQPAAPPAANQAESRPEKVPHCFFKDSETKDWAVEVQGGQAVVTGRGFRSDARYKVVLLEPKVDGAIAVVRPSISTNDTGFAADGNWWELKAAVPAAGLAKVEVRCGKKVLASLDLPQPAG